MADTEQDVSGENEGKTMFFAAERSSMKSALRGSVYILPNLFTTASMFAGFWSLVLAAQGNAEDAALAILFGALMDGLDGKVARLTNTASEFGIQYDSLADLVSFGIAPAFLVWMWQLSTFGRLGIGACFLFAACAALRLARFNVSTSVVSKKFFIGLPSPAAGCSLALLVLFVEFFPSWLSSIVPVFTLVLCIGVGLLMVSRVRYFSFKEYGFIKTYPFRSMVGVVVTFALIFSAPRLLAFLFCALYIVSGLVYSFVLNRRDKKRLTSLAEL